MSETIAEDGRGLSPTASAGDTLARRWAALAPYVARHGEPGVGPLVVLFHGCGGVQEHLQGYAAAAADNGCEVVVVDSYASRGWSRAFGLAFVCTGLMLHGRERAGDVLAALWGLSREGSGDRPIILAGWSHGAWSIMDLMTMPLREWGEAGVADPDLSLLARVKGLFLAYPYGGIGALSRVRPWLHALPILAIAPHDDHVTSLGDARRLYEAPRKAGCEVELWELDGTHSFDETSGIFPMRYDSPLATESIARFTAFVSRVAE
jgi:dienelactone hydrolase